ncbi:MAG: 50S ribosomal protein L23 [Trueperaceae bacterium]|nr:50S ribosomal protein L23 [Trueperaceae bacterium]MCO5174175.1 50S ribosomal protein L23 [Trueperaceae bacterium]MCW5820049.1 50S ribosomal protein L23 [Trueperaceae bacterium]
MNAYDVVLAPVLSEKAVTAIQSGKYSFYVHPHANRVQIREAIETAFKVDVVKVNLVTVKGKIKSLGRFSGRSPERKKAIVTLKAGQRIEQLEGLS